jgi:type VI protein secretion system component VasF
MATMNTLLIILIVLAMGGTLFALIKGIVAFLQTTEADLKSADGGVSRSAERQNKAMFMRVGFQAGAVVLVMLLLLLSRQG